jgi:hypothetical protein
VRAAKRRAAALACLATVVGADYVLHRHRPRWILMTLFDHPAHLATGALVLLNLGRRSPQWSSGFMVGALLPDVDHVPLALQDEHPSAGDPRPVSHCLLAIAPVGALALGTRSEAVAGTAAGMAAHFLRDLGAGESGLPLLWPATRRALRVPYTLYAATCLLLAGRATLEDGL